MHFLHVISQHPNVYAAAAAVFVLLALWIWARFGRHRYVHLRTSEPIQMLSVQIGRIADAIDHLATAVDRFERSSAAEPVEKTEVSERQAERRLGQSDRRVSMSMLGR